MPGAYSSFDTLSLEWSEAGPADAEPEATLPVLARISRVRPDRPEQNREGLQQVGAQQASERLVAEGPHDGLTTPSFAVNEVAATVFEVRSDEPSAIALEASESSSEAISPTANPPDASNPPRGTSDDAEAKHRIDGPQSASPSAGTPAFAPVADPSTVDENGPAALDEEIAESWLTTLARFEAAVEPYTKIIVLLTVLAAAGLVVVLLRGEAPRIDTTPGVAPSNPALPTLTSASPAAHSAPHPGSLTPLSPATASSAGLAPAVAKGPVGFARAKSGPASTSTIDRLEPYREPVTAPATRVAGAPLPRPAIADGSGGDPSASPAYDPPVARLSSRVLPTEEQAK